MKLCTKINSSVLLCMILLISFVLPDLSLYAQTDRSLDTYFPYMGRVKGKRINVRASARIGAEVMQQLESGTDIVVIGEESGWCRLNPPKDATAWVYSSLATDDIIVKDNVNIRAGATLSSSVLGKLHEGDSIVVIKEFEEWSQIEMPMGMGYYIHKDYVKYLSPLEEYEFFLEKEIKTKKLYREAEDYRREELRKRYFNVNYDELIRKYQKIIDFYPDALQAEKSLKRIADAQEKKKIAQTRIKSQKLNRKIIQKYEEAEEARRKIIYADSFDPADYDNVMAMYKKIIKDHPDSRAAKESLKRVSKLKSQKEKKMKEWNSQSNFSFKGTLEKGTTTATEKATHKIVDQYGEVLAFIYSNNVDLRAYEERFVTVDGTKYTSTENTRGKLIPVIKLKKISLD